MDALEKGRYLEQVARKKLSKRLLQNSSCANSSARRVRFPVSKCRKMSLKARSLKVSAMGQRIKEHTKKP